MRTVRRNSIEAREMWNKATRATSYTLGNYFVGEEVTVEGAKAWYDRMQAAGGRQKITYDGRAYTIRYHSNHWTTLETALEKVAETAPEKAEPKPVIWGPGDPDYDETATMRRPDDE
jgi:hypothetical protein